MSLLYGLALLVTTGCLVLCDLRWRLVAFVAPRRALAVVGAGVVLFLLWDLGGIALDVFLRGSGPWMTGLLIAPELPVEEVLFLTMLSYLTLLLYVGAGRLLARRGVEDGVAEP